MYMKTSLVLDSPYALFKPVAQIDVECFYDLCILAQWSEENNVAV